MENKPHSLDPVCINLPTDVDIPHGKWGLRVFHCHNLCTENEWLWGWHAVTKLQVDCAYSMYMHTQWLPLTYTHHLDKANKAYVLPILQTIPHPLLQQPVTLYSHCKTFYTSLGIPIFVMCSHEHGNSHKCILTFRLRIQYLHVYYIWYFCIDWAYNTHIFRIDLFDPSSLQEWGWFWRMYVSISLCNSNFFCRC